MYQDFSDRDSRELEKMGNNQGLIKVTQFTNFIKDTLKLDTDDKLFNKFLDNNKKSGTDYIQIDSILEGIKFEKKALKDIKYIKEAASDLG